MHRPFRRCGRVVQRRGLVPKLSDAAQHDDGHGVTEDGWGGGIVSRISAVQPTASVVTTIKRASLGATSGLALKMTVNSYVLLATLNRAGYGCRPARRGEFDIQQWLAE